MPPPVRVEQMPACVHTHICACKAAAAVAGQKTPNHRKTTPTTTFVSWQYTTRPHVVDDVGGFLTGKFCWKQPTCTHGTFVLVGCRIVVSELEPVGSACAAQTSKKLEPSSVVRHMPRPTTTEPATSSISDDKKCNGQKWVVGPGVKKPARHEAVPHRAGTEREPS